MENARTDGMQVVLRAAAFASHKHREQRRKDRKSTPYINHPIALALVLREVGRVRDSSVIAAALLHDTIEDTVTTYNELRGEFGLEIANYVREVTDAKFVGKDARKRLQVSKAGHSSKAARLIKLADKICNLRDILATPPVGWSVERGHAYFDWCKDVVDGIRGTNARLEKKFDQLYMQRSKIGAVRKKKRSLS